MGASQTGQCRQSMPHDLGKPWALFFAAADDDFAETSSTKLTISATQALAISNPGQ